MKETVMFIFGQLFSSYCLVRSRKIRKFTYNMRQHTKEKKTNQIVSSNSKIHKKRQQ